MPSPVSAIVPTYNAELYLRESLDSLLGQTVAPFEIVVVDDGSTDETPSILASYGSRIRVLQGAHGGLSAARNLGLAASTGDLIAFHDADDVAMPHRIESAVAFLRSQPRFDAIFFNGLRMGLADSPAARVVPALFAGRELSPVSVFEGFPVYFQGGLVPRRVFAAAGPFDVRYQVQPDLEYGYRIYSHCRATFLDDVCFRYRWHTTNMTRDRLAVREDIAQILDRLTVAAPGAVRQIGADVLRRRIARHFHRIGRIRQSRGDAVGAGTAFRRAAALQPLHPAYQWARLCYGRR